MEPVQDDKHRFAGTPDCSIAVHELLIVSISGGKFLEIMPEFD